MKSEKEKMLAGELYDALDKQLTDERVKARLLLKELNDTREDQHGKKGKYSKAAVAERRQWFMAATTILL